MWKRLFGRQGAEKKVERELRFKIVEEGPVEQPTIQRSRYEKMKTDKPSDEDWLSFCKMTTIHEDFSQRNHLRSHIS